MRSRLQGRLVAALLAPALIASAAAQGLLLMRCGPAGRMSCCCPKTEAPPPAPTIAAEAARCCSTLAIPGAPSQATHENAVTSAPLPMLVAVAHEAPGLDLAVSRRGRAPSLDPPPGPSPVLANCALLI